MSDYDTAMAGVLYDDWDNWYLGMNNYIQIVLCGM